MQIVHECFVRVLVKGMFGHGEVESPYEQLCSYFIWSLPNLLSHLTKRGNELPSACNIVFLGGMAASCRLALPLSFHWWITPDICVESYTTTLRELSETTDFRRKTSRKSVLFYFCISPTGKLRQQMSCNGLSYSTWVNQWPGLLPIPVLSSKRLWQNAKCENPASKSLSLLFLSSRWTGPHLWDGVVSKSAFLCHTFRIFTERVILFKDLKLEFKSYWLKKKEPGRSATEINVLGQKIWK